MQKGNIGVTTENIFPIIKKFLYSDHEIFLRELVSNAVDATQKLKTLASTGEFKGELGDLTVHVSADKGKGTLTIRALFNFGHSPCSTTCFMSSLTALLPMSIAANDCGQPGFFAEFRFFPVQPGGMRCLGQSRLVLA